MNVAAKQRKKRINNIRYLCFKTLRILRIFAVKEVLLALVPTCPG